MISYNVFLYFFQKSGVHGKKQSDGLFVDEEFPATLESIFQKKCLLKPVTWKRPVVKLFNKK
jgi:hypothetical protein